MGSEWTHCQLGDLAAIQGGFAFKSRDFLETGVPVAKIRNVRNRDIDLSEADCVSEDIAKEHSDFYIREGDVLISMTGSGINAPASIVGRVARHTGSSGAFLINQRVGRFIVYDNEKADLRYLYYFFSSSHIRNLLVSIATGSANQVNISRKQIESVELPLPPIREQQAIAHILGTLDDKIELNRRMNVTLEAMAQSLFKSWFVDFDPVIDKALAAENPIPEPLQKQAEARKALGDQRKPLPASIAQHFPDRFVFNEEMGWIPEGCQSGSLGDIVKQRNERIEPSEETQVMPYVPIDCISSHSLSLQSSKGGAEAKSSLIKFYSGDILFGAMRPYFHKVCIAPFDGTTRTTAFVLAPRERADYSFSVLQLHQKRTVEYATTHSTGTTIPYANWTKALSRMQIISPPVELRRMFGESLHDVLKRIVSTYFANRALASLRDTLLPKLLSGELRIPDAEKQIEKAL